MKKIIENSFKIAATLLKALLLSRPVTAMPRAISERIIILGNGPSLRTALTEDAAALRSNTLMAVNFAANTPEIRALKPRYYILADGHFFEGEKRDENVEKLWDNLVATDYEMTLFVPTARKKWAEMRLKGSPVKVATFNLTPAEGFSAVTSLLFRMRMAMPRPRNVMIPAIMAAIAMGYKEIYLAGADHTWSRSLWVDDQNRVISVQPHFYADNEKERERVENEYAGYHLHDILGSMTIAFRSYVEIADYARKCGIDIYNSTPGSFIDAFPRRRLP